MMKNKTNIRGMLLCLLLTGSLLAYGDDAGGLPLVNTKNFSLEGVKNLSIDYGSGEMILRESATGELIIKEYMTTDRSRYHALISRSGDSLSIRPGRRPWFSWNWRARAEIYLPRSFRENIRIANGSGSSTAETDLTGYRSIDLSVSSGYLFLNHVAAETFSVRVSSGKLGIQRMEGNSLISVSSGKLQIDELTGDTHRIRVSSGRLVITEARGQVEGRLSSGNVDMENFFGHGSFDISSGNINLGLWKPAGDMRFDVSSGNIHLTIPRKFSFNLDAVTNSGSVSVDDGPEGTVRVRGNSTVLRPFGPDPEVTLYARTTSGSIRITRSF
jgi:hypothetical protein